MLRLAFAAVIAGLSGLGGSASLAADPADAERPNIVFVLADDWGWGDLGCYGHDRLRTPNLDRLASQGTRFTHYYQCGSVCSPSRTALMTGKYPARFAMHGHLAETRLNQARGMPNWLDPKALTLPKVLKQAGYATGHYGKWHLGSGPGAPLPDRYGFDAWKISSAGPTTDWEVTSRDFRPRSTELIVDETVKFIREHQGGPFYVQAWLMDTHAILNPTDEQLAAYPNLQPKGLRFSNPAQVYYAAATSADTHLGRLFRALDELDLARRTIVIFSSDNGPEAMEIGNASHSGVGSPGPFRGRKRSLYEGGIRVPFIVRWPGVTPAGQVDDRSVIAGADLLPTLAHAAGVPLPDGLQLDGEDRLAVLRGVPGSRTRPLHWEWRFRIAGHVHNRSPILAIRDGDWKLLANPDGSRTELYKLPADPGEELNLARDHPEIVERLKAQAIAWQRTLPPGPFDPGAGSNAYPWPKSGTVAAPRPAARRAATPKS